MLQLEDMNGAIGRFSDVIEHVADTMSDSSVVMTVIRSHERHCINAGSGVRRYDTCGSTEV